MTSFFRATFLLVIFQQLVFNAAAQNERIYDLIPYRGKTKWGMAHHDGKIFYKPVLDTIYERFQGYYPPAIFHVSEFGDTIVNVVMNGKPYILKSDKRILTPDEYALINKGRTYYEADENKVFTKVDLSDTAWLQTISGKKAAIIYSPQKKIFTVAVNGKLIKNAVFDQYDFPRYPAEKKENRYMIIYKEHMKGCIDLEIEKISIPCIYSNLWFLTQRKDWLVADNGRIITMNNKPVGRKFTEMREVFFPFANGAAMFFIVKDNLKKYRFYYPEKDSLCTQSYDELWEVCGTNEYATNHITKALFRVARKDSCSIIGGNNEFMVPFQKKQFYPQGRFVSIVHDGKSGFIDLANNFYSIEPVYDKLSYPIRMNFWLKGLPYYVFLANKEGVNFYIDNFGHEFIEK